MGLSGTRPSVTFLQICKIHVCDVIMYIFSHHLALQSCAGTDSLPFGLIQIICYFFISGSERLLTITPTRSMLIRLDERRLNKLKLTFWERRWVKWRRSKKRHREGERGGNVQQVSPWGSGKKNFTKGGVRREWKWSTMELICRNLNRYKLISRYLLHQ